MVKKEGNETRGAETRPAFFFSNGDKKPRKTPKFQKMTKKTAEITFKLKQYSGQPHNIGGGCYAKNIVFKMRRGGFRVRSLEQAFSAVMCSVPHVADCLHGCGTFRA
jgi:hypothetical protein